MVTKTKYNFGDTVFMKTDPEQLEYTMIGILHRPGSITYEVRYKEEILEVYDFEISENRDVLKALLDTSKSDD